MSDKKKKFEINVDAKDETKTVGEEVVDKNDVKVETDVEPAPKTKAEQILGEMNDTSSDISEEKQEEIPKVEAEKIEPEEAEQMEAKQNTKEEINKEDVSKIAGEATNILNNIKDFISGDKFDEQCEEAAKKHNVDKEIVKNSFVKNILRAIGNTLGLVVVTTGDVITGAVCFISRIINTIVDFAVDSLLKLINMATLNCANK